MIVLFGFSINVNSKTWLIGGKIHSFCIFVISFIFKFSSFLYIQHSVLRFRKISWNNLISLVPFISSDIHLKCFNKFSSINIIFFSKIKLSHFRVMLSYLFIIGSWNFRRLIGNKLNGSIPFSRIQSSFNSFIENTCLNIVLNW